MPSRTYLALKNATFGVVGKALLLLLSFASRTVFIYTLGKYYLGISGLYTDILSVLSFAELGFGSAMTFAMYGPVARSEEQYVVQLLGFYKKVYRIVACVIAVGGVALLPFLQYIVTGADAITLAELRLYFLFYLTNTVVSYFVTYKYAYVNALQRTYLTTNIDNLTTAITSIAQMAILFITHSFLAYLITQTALLTVSRVVAALYLNKAYPVLHEKPEELLPKRERKKIYHEVKGLMVHQFASIAVHSTDSIIISAMPALGVVIVGLVSNYNTIINAVLAFALIVFNSVSAGFGNLVAMNDKAAFKRAFFQMNFINFWVYGLCSVGFLVLLPPFIELWIGESYLIDTLSLALIIVNCYLQGQCTIYNNARIAKGDFNRDKLWAVVQAIVNLVVSVAAAMLMGLPGVYVGTVVSRLVFVIARPTCTYRFLFGESPWEYYSVFLKYLGVVILAAVLCVLATQPILAGGGIVGFLAAGAVVLVVVNGLFALLFRKSPEYRALKKRVASMLSGRRR